MNSCTSSTMTEPVEEPIQVDYKELLKIGVDKEQLECFTESPGDFDKQKAQLDNVFKSSTNLDEYDEKKNTTQRKKWKKHRIELYDNLLLLALGAEGESWKSWESSELWYKKASDKLKPGSIYTYFLDQIIHEDEEVMFNFYHVRNDPDKRHHEWLDRATWLVRSIRLYRKYLLDSVVKALGDWNVGKEVEAGRVRKEEAKGVGTRKKKNKKEQEGVGEKEQKLLDSAKAAFETTVKSLGRDWSARSWRNRARLYRVLSLAKHTPIVISKQGPKLGKFKGFEYIGPIGFLVRQMMEEDLDMLSEHSSHSIFHYRKAKYDKKEKDLLLGNLKICRLLAWASAANDHDLVERVLQHNANCTKSNPDYDYWWEASWKESWAMALWNASFRGHAEVVEKLLRCKFPYHEEYSKYFSSNKQAPSKRVASKDAGIPSKDAGAASKDAGAPSKDAGAASHKQVEPPLHVAVRRRHIAVVNIFCKLASFHFSCHEENAYDETPLAVATKLKCEFPNEFAIKRKIQSILLQRHEVKDAVEVANKQRELTANSANAIIVGATLVAAITFGGWLQPPLGYHLYYQFAEPLPAPPDSYESYMSIQGQRTVQVFAIFNSLAFFFAIAAVIAGLDTTCFIKGIEDMYVTRWKKLQSELKWTTTLFIISVICVLIAFASAGMAILPPMEQYQRSMYITIAIGGFFCVVCIWKLLLFSVSKRVNTWTNDQIESLSRVLKGRKCE